ncbi:MAG: T9SS type A sorting domain-containing protein [Chlorobi bacterium]|nr:T9SS type A sorting domain-containing protein [Chlorobiota bacterium]
MNNNNIIIAVCFSIISLFIPQWANGQCSADAVIQGPDSCNQTVFLDLNGLSPGFSFTVNWGDGVIDTMPSSGLYSHTYQSGGLYFPFVVVHPCGDTIYPMSINCVILPDSITMVCDTSTNVYIPDSCGSILGFAYIDVNGNCSFDSLDIPLHGLQALALSNSNYITHAFVSQSGFFELFVSATDTYTVFIDSNAIANMGLVPSCGYPNGVQATTRDTLVFPFTCNNSYDLTINIFTSLFAQVAPRCLYFTVGNNACSPITADITLSLPPELNFTGTIYTHYNNTSIPFTVSGNNIVFNNVNMDPFSSLHGCIMVQADSLSTSLGDTLCVTGTVEPTAGDADTTNNTDVTCGVVVTSYDPNDKQVAIEGVNANGFVEPNKTMEYLIRFQNMGSYYAKRVIIIDTLSPHLNWQSLNLVSSSHPVRIIQDNSIVHFIFDNIWLAPKDSDEAASQGFIFFTIDQKPDLTPGTEITNFADIYFDYNPPVRTNEVISIIREPKGPLGLETSEQLTVKVFPNPASKNIHVLLSNSTMADVSLYNLSGQVVFNTKGSGNVTIGVSNLPAGIYLLMITTKDGHQETYKVKIN